MVRMASGLCSQVIIIIILFIHIDLCRLRLTEFICHVEFRQHKPFWDLMAKLGRNLIHGRSNSNQAGPWVLFGWLVDCAVGSSYHTIHSY